MSSTDVMVLMVAAVAVVVAWLSVLRARVELRSHRAAYPHTAEDLVAARRDSVARSHAVVSGKVREHLVPLLPEFAGRFDGRDARFLGSPVDFVVFDGLDAGSVERVVFVEVKTGLSALSSRERQVRDAVERGRVEWQVLRLPAAGPAPLPDPSSGGLPSREATSPVQPASLPPGADPPEPTTRRSTTSARPGRRGWRGG